MKRGKAHHLIRIGIFLVGLLILSVAGTGYAQDDFPSRPITIYVGYKLGGTTGTSATIVGKYLEQHLKTPVKIVEKGGASGTLALGTVAREPADGYSLAIGSYSTLISGPYSYNLPYDSQRDIDPLYAYSMYHSGFAVRSDSPCHTFRDYLDWAKAHPGEAKWGSAGAMTFGHLVMEYIGFLEGIDWRPLGCKGGSAAAKLLLGGQTNGQVATGSQIPMIKGGQMRLLADFTPAQTPTLYSYVPAAVIDRVVTLDMVGYGDLAFYNPIIVFAKKGMPEKVRNVLVEALQKATYDEKLVAMLGKFNMPVLHNGGDEFFQKTKEPMQELALKMLTDMGRIK